MNNAFSRSWGAASIKKYTHSLVALVRVPTVKNFFIYSFGAVALRGISIFTAPITMSVLSTDDYGLLALVNNFISVFAMIAGFGLRQVFGIEFFHASPDQHKHIINDIIIAYLVVATPLFAIALTNLTYLNHIVFVGKASTALMIISIIICFVYFFVELFYQVLQYRTKAIQLTILQTSIALITLGLNLVFLCYFGWGPYSIIQGTLIGMLLVLCIGLRAYLKTSCPQNLCVKNSIKKMPTYLKMGFPFIPSVLFGWVLSSGDRWVLAHYATLHDVGIYSLADTFALMFQLIVLVPMTSSYLPYLFRQFSENKTTTVQIELHNQKIMWRCMLATGILIVICYVLFKPLLLWILPVKFQPALSYILMILCGQVFLMGHYFLSAFIQFHKHTYFGAIALCIAAVLNIGLNIVLIPFWGIFGCTLATFIAYIVYFFSTLWYNRLLQRRYN